MISAAPFCFALVLCVLQHEPGVRRQLRQLPSASAAAGLIKLKGDKLKGDRAAAQVGAGYFNLLF
jgi:hypothetical protein